MSQSLFEPFVSNRLADFYRYDIVEINPEFFFFAKTRAAQRTCFVHATDGDIVKAVRSMTGRDIMYSDALAGMVTLKERGNLFKLLFETGPVAFRDLSEELMFWHEFGYIVEVRNEATGYYTGWTIQQAFDALWSGDIDAVFPLEAFAGSRLINPTVLDYGFRFIDPQDARSVRVRRSMLTALKQAVSQLHRRR